jgi:hypothetical protein
MRVMNSILAWRREAAMMTLTATKIRVPKGKRRLPVSLLLGAGPAK